jgi:hypothetical protein
MKEYEEEQRKADVGAGPGWAISVIITVTTGVAALGIMAWALGSVLWTGLFF